MPDSTLFAPSLAPATWQQRLAGATTTTDVLWTVKDYLATWSVDDMASLPHQCRPGRLSDAEDVASYAVTLVREQFENDENAELHRMATFVARASHRLSFLMTYAAAFVPSQPATSQTTGD
jgi:hypothetical protein